MELIKDYLEEDSVISQFNRLREELLEEFPKYGIEVDEGGWPDLAKSFAAAKGGQSYVHADFFDGETNLNTILAHALNDEKQAYSSKEYQQLITKLKNVVKSQDVIQSPEWEVDYDIVSKTYLLIAAGLTMDNEAMSVKNSSLTAIKHNLNYYKKIGPTSVFQQEYLDAAEMGYTRHEKIEWDPEFKKCLCLEIKRMQDRSKTLHAKRLPLEATTEIAESKNNKNFCGPPLYGNVTLDNNRETLFGIAKAQDGKFNEDEIDASFELHRIQNANNVLIDRANITVDEQEGKIMWSRSALLEAIASCASERGYYTYYANKEPKSVPEIANLIKYSALPYSPEARQALIDSGEAPAYILNKFNNTGDWKFNYVISVPQIFVTGLDDDVEWVKPDTIKTKHRSIKALASYLSRIGQSYLYPHDNAVREKIRTLDYGCSVKLNHPDEFLRYFTDLVSVANIDYAKKEQLKTSFTMENLEKFLEYAKTKGVEGFMISMDDKDGFDMCDCAIILWIYAVTYLPFEFDEKTEVDYNNWKRLIRALQVCYLITGNGVMLLSELITSGHPWTNKYGSYKSELFGTAIADMMAEDLETILGPLTADAESEQKSDINEEPDEGLLEDRVQAEEQTNSEPFNSNDYLDNGIPLLSLSNGDDYGGLVPMRKYEYVEYLPLMYKKYTGMIVSVLKSLFGKCDGEVNRNEIRPGYAIEVKSGNPGGLEPGRYIVFSKPTGRALAPCAFTEDYPMITPLVNGCAIVSKLFNLNYAPKLSTLIRELKEDMPFKLFTVENWYVPTYNVKDWIAAGKPAKSSFHVRIRNVQQAFKISGYETYYLETGLVPRSADQKKEAEEAFFKKVNGSYNSQQAEYDISEYFFNSRLLRMLNAFKEGNLKLVEDIENEVFFLESFDEIFNSHGDVEEEVDAKPVVESRAFKKMTIID